MSKQGKKTKVLQKNVTLFGQLYISMQNRDGDLAEFLHTRYSPVLNHRGYRGGSPTAVQA